MRALLKASIASLFLIVSSNALATPASPAPVSQGSGSSVKAPSRPQPIRPDKPAPVSFKMPKQVNPTMKATTWDVTERQVFTGSTTRVDPYKVDVQGVQRGTELHVSVQAPSANIELPEGVERIPATSASVRKEVNKDFNKQLAANVGKAVKENPLFSATSDVDSAKQTFSVEKPETLPTHAPLTLRGRDIFNRPLTPAHASAEGLPTTTTRNGNMEITKRGDTVKAYEPWANMTNILSTPAYERGGKTFAKVLGLAAFPRNATVKLTNTRLRGEGLEASEHTVEMTKLSSAGAGTVEVPALQGDRIQIDVSYPAVNGQSQGSSKTYFYNVPMASKSALRDAQYRTNSGVAYLPVEEVK